MGEWATYRLQDFLLFAPQTYHRLFEIHNAALWPLQWLWLVLGTLMAGLAAAPRYRAGPPAVRRFGPPVALAVLAGAWALVGAGFHWRRYADINWAAEWFGAACLVQAGLLAAAAGVLGARSEPSREPSPSRQQHACPVGIGAVFIAFALLQPWLGLLQGRSWRQAEWFGIAPDPTALASFGVLLMLLPSCAASMPGRWLLRSCWPIPLAWSVISGATLLAMESPFAWLLPAAALLASGAALIAARQRG